MEIAIKEVNYGIGALLFNKKVRYIQINKNLKKYPKLYEYIITHELEHAEQKGLIDFKTDLKDTFNYRLAWQLIKFMFRHPRALSIFCPILVTRDCIMFDWFKILLYSIILILIGIGMVI